MTVKVAILWHMHQPNYQEPHSRRMVLPWVRLHGLKDYLDMVLLATEHENVQVTINLVPALLDQVELYVDGGSDRHLELSRLPADQLSDELRREILGSFLSAHPPTMIRPYARFAELYDKVRDNAGDPILAALFTSEELRDLQVWSNLVWVDPAFRQEEPVRSLLSKGRYFTEEDKNQLLDWQVNLLARIVPTYRELYRSGRVDVSFTPYYHPILPLLCDTDSAREAMPGITLPARPFRHPEDAEQQIVMAQERFQELFDRPMAGMWPSEGSISEAVARLCLKLGIKWIASDEEVLYASLRKALADRNVNPAHALYEFGPGLKVFFRDHGLSDRIGFVYASWDADRAVDDLIARIKDIGRLASARVDDVVVPIILDGENAWEYYPDDGREFLRLLYRRLAEDPELESASMSRAAEMCRPRPLPAVFAGSWINHNFRIWIGHHEDNAAWDLLITAREALVRWEREHPDGPARTAEAAWRQIYIAEGSDWCWWYGDEHRGRDNQTFDRIFRRHLQAMYELLDIEVPDSLLMPIYQGETKSLTVLPESLLTPRLDGLVTHFYEWAGAGFYNVAEAGGAMHRVDRQLGCIYFVYDRDHFYIRLDFANKNSLESLKEPIFQFSFKTPEAMVVSIPAKRGEEKSDPGGLYRFALDEVFELAVPRSRLWPEGFGTLDFTVTLRDGRHKLESWPEGKPISVEVYEPDREMFWP